MAGYAVQGGGCRVDCWLGGTDAGLAGKLRELHSEDRHKIVSVTLPS